MANERVKLMRNTGTQEAPIWEQWFAKTVADAVMMSDAAGETQNVKQYVDNKIADLIGGAPSTFDTLKEIADYIEAHKEVSEALEAAIGNKVDKVAGKQLSTNDYTTAEKSKLAGIASSANNYIHPASHPATMITGLPTSLPANGGNASTVNGHSVNSDVPANAKFTDTVYTHPATHAASMITQDATHRMVTDAEKTAWNGKANVIFASSLPTTAQPGTICFLTD